MGIDRISWSQITKRNTCHQAYHLHYNMGWRTRYENAALRFGRLIEIPIFRPWYPDPPAEQDELAVALEIWDEGWGGVRQDPKVRYSKKESWETLQKAGEGILRDFYSKIRRRMLEGECQVRLDRPIWGDKSGMGFADWIGKIASYDHTVYLDCKSAGKQWPVERVRRDEQTTNYGFLGGEEKPFISAYLILVKTKGGYAELHIREDDPKTDGEIIRRRYMEHIFSVGEDFDFDKALIGWDGSPCKMCDFRPICFEDEDTARADLIQVQK